LKTSPSISPPEKLRVGGSTAFSHKTLEVAAIARHCPAWGGRQLVDAAHFDPDRFHPITA
jgi:hypothetical protein